MKTILSLTMFVAIVLLIAAGEAGATGASEDRYAFCKQSCEANYDVICKPALDRQQRGDITQDQVDQLCTCGILLCANVCTTELGEPTQVRPYPEACVELGVI